MGSFAAGIIGCGVMGAALARRLAASGKIAPPELWLFDVEGQKSAAVAMELGAKAATEPEALFRQCRYIFVVVKPQDVKAAASGWAELFQPPGQLLISLAAGITTRFYEALLPEGSKVIRLMPNTPCLIGEGAVAMSAGKAVTPQEAAEVEDLLRCLGLVVPVPEQAMDAVTALSGSGPAYVYLFIETLIDAGVNWLEPRHRQGAGRADCSRGGADGPGQQPPPCGTAQRRDLARGTTAAALEVLDGGRFRGDLISAVKAAARRAGELSHD